MASNAPDATVGSHSPHLPFLGPLVPRSLGPYFPFSPKRFRSHASIACLALLLTSCSPNEPNNLSALDETDVQIGNHKFRAWIADTPDKQERGLMFIEADQMAPLADGTERAMLFVFDSSRRTGFWMKNTVIPLDIAYIRADGTIDSIHTMAPLDTRGYFPNGSYLYALEVRGNYFSTVNIKSGQKVEFDLPDASEAP